MPPHLRVDEALSSKAAHRREAQKCSGVPLPVRGRGGLRMAVKQRTAARRYLVGIWAVSGRYLDGAQTGEIGAVKSER
tara:strand:- start:30074 stop:30307 length:234 start_codon:yes stop_codon:yes gene_type:complete